MESDIRIEKVLGIDNTSDPAALKKGFLREILNIDIDNQGKVHRRKGGDNLVFAGSGIHSLWSNDKLCLFVQGTNFRKLKTDYTAETLVSAVNPTDRMSYVSVADIVYFASRSIIGRIINELPHPFPRATQSFKTQMVGGQLLEVFNNRLYAANDQNLFFSDATVLTQMDKRKNAIPIPGYITMLKAVKDGLYISGGGKTYFLQGDSPFGFASAKVLDCDAIFGTAFTVEKDDIGRGVRGTAIYWVGTDGFPYKGYPGGMVVQAQAGLFKSSPLIESGTAIMREIGQYRQYLALCQLKPGVGGISGTFESPTPTFE